jgi:TatD DNase family protein
VIELFDSHAHLQEPEFERDVDQVIERARKAGVEGVVVPAVDIATARSAIGLAEGFDGIYATAGCHPHEASHLDRKHLMEVGNLLEHPKVVAVGEIGLDFYRMHSSQQAQLSAFDAMLTLAEDRVMPVVVHCREAWPALADQLVPWGSRVAQRFVGQPLGVLHYFSGSLEDAERYVGLGFLISVHTSVTHPKAVALRAVVSSTPLDSLIVETDSPYGAPQAFRGKRNEPAFVVEAARQIAEVKGLALQEVADATTANARRLFRLGVTTGTPA